MRYLYMIKGAGNHYKIGIATHPERRLKELQTGNSGRLSLICTRLFEDAEGTEIYLHSMLKIHNTNGGTEWFNLEPEDVIKVLKVIHERPSVTMIDELIMLRKIVDNSSNLNKKIDEYIIAKSTKTLKKIRSEPYYAYASRSEEEIIELAKIVFMEAGKGSTSLLQRKLKIGYSKAARIMDHLTKSGFLSDPDDMYHAREVLVKK